MYTDPPLGGVEVFVSTRGPPDGSTHMHLAIWKDGQAYEADDDFLEAVDFSKVTSVRPSSQGNNLFEVNYAESASDKRQLLFAAVDRPREQWVDALVAFIEMRHAAEMS